MAHAAPAAGETVAHAHAPATAPTPAWLDLTLDTVLSLALLGELTVLLGNVVARGLFHTSLLWSQEVAQLTLTVLTFVGGAVAFNRGQHMAVQAVVQHLSPRARLAVDTASNWLVVALALLGVGLSLQVMQSRLHEHTAILGIAETWFTLPLMVGMGLVAYYALNRLRLAPLRTVLATGALVVALLGVLVLAQTFLEFSPASLLWFTFGALAVLLLIGLPIGFVLPMVSLLYLYYSGSAPLFAVPIAMQAGIQSFVLLAVPFFILAGFIMTEGGLSKPLANFVRTLVGHFRGGLHQVIIISMYIFSGISGAKVADVAAVGTTMREMLEEGGYEPAENVAVLAASAIMGETVPPSVAMLVLGSISTLSVSALFMAGIVPAALMALCLMVAVYIKARLSGRPPSVRSAWAERRQATVKAIPAMLVPLILVGGILLGVATPTEVSSFAVVYALVLSAVVYKALNLRNFRRMLSDTATMAGMILFIISTGGGFSWSLTVANLPQKIATLLTALGGSQALFMVATVVTLIIMGAVLEGLPALLIFGPLLLPVAQQFGVNPLQYGIVLIFAMGFGSFAPPIGVGLYVACSVGGASVEAATRRMIPYLAVLLVGLLMVAFVPWFSLVVPHLLHMGN